MLFQKIYLSWLSRALNCSSGDFNFVKVLVRFLTAPLLLANDDSDWDEIKDDILTAKSINSIKETLKLYIQITSLLF